MAELDQCCKILGIDPDAGPDEIKQAYRDLIKVWHPDRFSDNPRLQRKAQKQLADINLAYKELVSTKDSDRAARGTGSRRPDKRTKATAPTGGKAGRFFSIRKLAPVLGLPLALVAIGWFILPPIKGDLAEIPYNVGASYLQSGRYNEASKAFRLALLINPENPRAFVKLGETNLGLANYGKARDAFSEAVRINPSGLNAYLGLASSYGRLGSPEKEIATYRQALRIAPDSLEAHYSLGLACEKNGMFKDAQEAFSLALLIDPQYDSAQHKLALMYGIRGQYREAVEALERAARINPGNAGIYNDLGAMYEKLGLHMQELEAYRKAIDINPSSGEAHFNFALVNLRLGHVSAAHKELETLRTLDPSLAFKLYRMIAQKKS